MARTLKADYRATVAVEIEIADDVDFLNWVDDDGKTIPRMTGIYPDIVTEDQLRDHLAYNAVFNGVEDASRLDGYADLECGKVTMRVRPEALEAV